MSATLAGRWRQAVEANADGTFLVWEGIDGAAHTWSYSAFDDLVARVAGGLTDVGARRGSAIHVALANSPAFVAVWLAAIRLGAWIVPSDPGATAPELAGHLERTRPVVAVCGADRLRAYRASTDLVDESPPVIAVGESDVELDTLTGPPVVWSERAEPGPRERAAVMFTSGTTAAPKGVIVTQANYAFAGDVMAGAAGLGRDDRQLVVLPLFHANAQYYSFAAAISVAASVALMPRFSASQFLAQAARHRATHASLFAAPMRMILARGAVPVDGLHLRHCWYAQNITDDQYQLLADLLGCAPRQLYGMTETVPAVLTNRALDPVPSLMGEQTVGCRVDLRRQDDGSAISSGEVGEIVVAGERGRTLFDGYLDDAATTTASYRDGWFRTGDLATRDEDGRYAFAGRRSDVLKVAGENVSVVEVEAVLAEHPSVLEAAVIGEPDAIRDEVPVGFVVQRPDRPAIEVEELIEWCVARLVKSKRPQRIELVDELPRTSVGKIRKFLLRSGGQAVHQ